MSVLGWVYSSGEGKPKDMVEGKIALTSKNNQLVAIRIIEAILMIIVIVQKQCSCSGCRQSTNSWPGREQ